jgi:cytochrome P450
MNQGKLFEQILDPANRHNPYPLYAQLREAPISQQEDGTYVVSTYREIEALLYDPRISSDERKSTRGAGKWPRDKHRKSLGAFSRSCSSTHPIITVSVAW